MEANRKPNEDESFRSVLRAWVVDTPLPPRFQEQVWQRISRADAQAKPAFWEGLNRLLDRVLPRPQIAFAYLSTLLILGVTAGSVTAQLKTSRLEANLGARYVQSVDPYQMQTSQP